MSVSTVSTARHDGPAPAGTPARGEFPWHAYHDELLRLGLWLLEEHQPAAYAVIDTMTLARRERPASRHAWLVRLWLYRMMTRRCWHTLRKTSRPYQSFVWDGDLTFRTGHPAR